MVREHSSFYYRVQVALINFTQGLIVLYIAARIGYFFVYPLSWYFYLIAIVFFFAECFVLIHGWDYFGKIKVVARALATRKKLEPESPPLHSYPPVNIVVTSYKEPLNILEDTLVCFHNLTYPNKRLYFLDDTRYDQPWDTPEKVAAYKKAIEELCEYNEVNLFRHRWHDAKAGITNDFIDYCQGSENPDFRLVSYAKTPSEERAKYLVIFDADQNPFPGFIEPLVALLEVNPNLAFVQTPQYYTNFKDNKVARAASIMQVVFYEWICEAKGAKDLMMLCGTNVILRTEAIIDVGGFTLTSVTEDFATGYYIHKKGWTSWYINKPTAFGMGPEDLGAFFKQQHRWALGTSSMLPTVLKDLIFSGRNQSWAFWGEYLCSSSYYFIGWAYLIFILVPGFYLFFDFPVYMFPASVYVFLIVPYNVFANYLYFSTLRGRGYSVTDLFSGMCMGILCMPLNMHASLSGLLGRGGKFVVTPKGETNSLTMWDLWPQIALALLCFSCLVWGGLRLYFEQEPVVGLLVNMFWIAYYFFIYSTVFWYNSPQDQRVGAGAAAMA